MTFVLIKNLSLYHQIFAEILKKNSKFFIICNDEIVLLSKRFNSGGTENIEAAIDSCHNLIVETRLRSDYPPLILRLLGVLSISKDATTSKDELLHLSEYLCFKR